jgi:hypothetical protein
MEVVISFKKTKINRSLAKINRLNPSGKYMSHLRNSAYRQQCVSYDLTPIILLTIIKLFLRFWHRALSYSYTT